MSAKKQKILKTIGEAFKGDEQRMEQLNEKGKLCLLTMHSEQLSKRSLLFDVPKKAAIHELECLQYDSQQLQAMCTFDQFHEGEQISAGQFIRKLIGIMYSAYEGCSVTAF